MIAGLSLHAWLHADLDWVGDPKPERGLIQGEIICAPAPPPPPAFLAKRFFWGAYTGGGVIFRAPPWQELYTPPPPEGSFRGGSKTKRRGF